MYRRGDSLVCRTVCTDVGKHLYVGQCIQMWGNTLCSTVWTGVGQHLLVGQCVHV